VLGERMTQALAELRQSLAATMCRPDQRDWVGLKLLMGDPAFVSQVAAEGQPGQVTLDLARRWRERIESQTGQDIALFVSQGFAGFVDGLLREVTLQRRRADARAWSDRIDGLLAHRLLGLPIFGLVMYAIFFVTFAVGDLPMTWIEEGFGLLAGWISGLWPTGSDSALRSLLVDGIIHGVGGVIVFLPNILLLFFGLALLEDTGYMARAAHLVDHGMHRFGLHGKSFLPLLTGFGCSIPGIMATRTLENERDRLITMLVLPLMSCGARLPIWMLLIPAFFPPAWQAPMLWGIYAAGVGLALLLAKTLRHTLFRGEEAPFVMELPPYRWPTLRGLVVKMRERSWLYLRKAGTIILAISVLMWLISSYPKPEPIDRHQSTQADSRPTDEQRAADALRSSIAGRLGRTLETVLAPIGFDWKLATALVGAFAAKEVFVAQMGIVYALGEADETTVGLRRSLARDYSPLTALSLMIFLLIATPCMATVAITRRESGRWRWALLQFGGLTAIAYLLCLLVYQLGRLLM
jgi:ferrous iron transport protein B